MKSNIFTLLCFGLLFISCANKNDSDTSASPTDAVLNVFTGLYSSNSVHLYLGCWNCDKTRPDSIFNLDSTSNLPTRENSLYNKFGKYGSKFSSSAPCNVFGDDPPTLEVTLKKCPSSKNNKFRFSRNHFLENGICSNLTSSTDSCMRDFLALTCNELEIFCSER